MAEHKSAKKQGFLQGAAILTFGTLLVKLIGALYKIPMNRIIGTEGFGHFNVAYSIYNVLLMISSTGLPIAVSRMISEANTLGHKGQVQKIYQVSLRLFLVVGIICSVPMLVFAPQLASLMRDPDAVYAIAALAPAVLFVCIICSFRGYFQGQQYMTPTAVSQVIEALCKLVVGLGAVFLLLHFGFGVAEAAGGAILGVTAGTVFSALYLFWVYRRRHVKLTEGIELGPVKSSRETAMQLLRLAVPITIGSAGLQIFNALDTMIIQGRLQDAIGLSSKEATAMFGTYSAAQTFYMLPSALVQPLAISVIPTVTAALTLGSYRKAQKTEESAFRMTALIGLPCGAGLAVLASPIQKLAYGYDVDTLQVAGPILALLGIAVIFNCMVTVTNGILQAHGKVNIPIYTTLVGGLVNIITDYVLIGMGTFHIYGAAIATIAYCAVIMFLNVFAMHRTMDLPPRILRQFVKPIVATAIMATAAYFSYEAVYSLLSSGTLATLVSVCVAAIVYFALVYFMKIITWDDCQLLPKSELLARILKVKPLAEED
jgi:stage V sporulation protein B